MILQDGFCLVAATSPFLGKVDVFFGWFLSIRPPGWQLLLNRQTIFSSWWFHQPIRKNIFVKMGSSCSSSPNFRVKKIKKHVWKLPPPRYTYICLSLKLNLDDFRFQEMIDLFFGGGGRMIDSLSLVPSAQVQVPELIFGGWKLPNPWHFNPWECMIYL